MKMSSRWLLLSDTLLNPLSLHVPSPCVCCTGVAAGLQDSQLHSGRPREGRELHRLLQRRGQALPHIGGRRPPGEDLGLSGNRTDCVLNRTATSIHLILIKSFFFYLIFHIISNLQSTPTCLITADSVWECHPYVFISLKEHCTVPGRKGNRKHTGTFTHYTEPMPILNWHIKIFASQKHIWPCPSLGSFPNHQPTDLYSQRTDSLRRLLLTCLIIKKCLTKPLVVELCTRLLTPEPRICLT